MKVEPKFDFTTGDFVVGHNGKIPLYSGRDALINRIEKALRTAKARFKVYLINEEGKKYGNGLERLIGKSFPRDYVSAEVERDVKETLLADSEIIAVDSFSVVQNDATLNISFKVTHIYGSDELTEVIEIG